VRKPDFFQQNLVRVVDEVITVIKVDLSSRPRTAK
jgi:hypothetical protein